MEDVGGALTRFQDLAEVGNVSLYELNIRAVWRDDVKDANVVRPFQ